MKYAAYCAVAFTVAVTGTAGAESLLERGEYLVEGPAACGNCHTAPVPDAAAFAGAELPMGSFVAQVPNLTPAGRVGGWTDEELGRAIREGIRPDGSVIGPPMPILMYRGLSDTDLAAIVAYIRTLDPVESDYTPTDYPFPLPPAWGPPVESVADIPRDTSIAYGAYLAGPVAHCLECHSMTAEEMPDFDNNLGGGGFVWHAPFGEVLFPNITNGPDGIAGYTDAELRRIITEGVRPDGSQMMPPMPYWGFARMTEDDLTAIVAYIRTLPPLDGN